MLDNVLGINVSDASFIESSSFTSSSPLFLSSSNLTYNSSYIAAQLGSNSDLVTYNSSYLTSQLGPRRQELWKVIPITVIYGVIFVFGLIGNICTCVVIAKNRFMQTTTNIYLFNLAISDVLMLVLGLPQETYIYWSAYPYIFGETFCIVRTMAAETSTNASILTITAFTVERYIAICHPIRSQTLSSNIYRVIRVIVGLWVFSAVCSIPMTIQFGLVQLTDPQGRDIPESATCTIRPGHFLKYAFEISTFMFFLTPMTIIIALYLLIGLAIKRSTRDRTASVTSEHSEVTGLELRAQQQQRARRSVIKMLVAVVVAFFICWGPFHVQRLMAIYMTHDQWTESFTRFQEFFYPATGVLYYVISVVNPVLYNVMSLKFRQAFKNTIFTSCARHGRVHRPSVVHRTYRFRNPGHDTDKHLTFVRANGFAVLFRDKKPVHEIQYIGPRSRSSSNSVGSFPIAAHVKLAEAGAHDAIDPDPVVKGLRPDADHRGDIVHSFHCQSRASTVSLGVERQYHSYT